MLLKQEPIYHLNFCNKNKSSKQMYLKDLILILIDIFPFDCKNKSFKKRLASRSLITSNHFYMLKIQFGSFLPHSSPVCRFTERNRDITNNIVASMFKNFRFFYFVRWTTKKVETTFLLFSKDWLVDLINESDCDCCVLSLHGCLEIQIFIKKEY